jgi:hypothetical protein
MSSGVGPDIKDHRARSDSKAKSLRLDKTSVSAALLASTAVSIYLHKMG